MKEVFKKENIKTHSYPNNFIPKDAKVFSGYDLSDGKETTVKGFWLNGKFYIQEVIERTKPC